MWNSLFLRCVGPRQCVDKSVDDVSFLSYIITNMQQLLSGLPIKPQVAVSGYSNGGMMIQTLLCKQPDIANNLAGVALIATMMGTDFASSSCKQKLPRSLPLVWVHGVQDPVLPFKPGSSQGVKALRAGKGGYKMSIPTMALFLTATAQASLLCRMCKERQSSVCLQHATAALSQS